MDGQPHSLLPVMKFEVEKAGIFFRDSFCHGHYSSFSRSGFFYFCVFQCLLVEGRCGDWIDYFFTVFIGGY